MAQEEIKLIGSFKDDITPQLKKLNKELANIGRSFERFNKKIAPVTKSFSKMAMSARAFGDAMKLQRSGIETSARAMREYSRQAGKMTGAMRKVTDQRARAQRAMGVSRAEARKGGGAMPGMGGGGSSGGPGSGAAYGASAAKSFNSGIGSIAIGSAIGNIASTAIMQGVSKLGSLLAAPFNKFASAFSERIGDEMDDIKSAGGLFALDMDLTQESGNERFFKNYNESLRFQEKLNIDMAESAAALPGVTSQYVSTSRQLTDTIQMVMEKDRESFTKMAARYGADISQGGTDAAKNAMQTILKKQTEQVVLQSQGQSGGLPMHIAIQQLMGKEAKDGKIGVQAFTNKFRAAFQKNPLLKNFLIRAEEDLAKTDAGSVERLQKIIEVFDAAMPVEVINKMRGSISGMMEALRSGLLDPQAGLFGMSRAVFAQAGTDAQFVDESGKLLKKNVNDFGEFIYKFSADFEDTAGITKELGLTNTKNLKGQELTLKQLEKLNLSINKNNQIIDAQGKVYGEISRSNTYLFEQIREILAGFGPVLLEFVGFLPMLFDPFTQMTQSLMPLRDAAQQFIAGFNNNVNAIEKEAQAYAASSDAATAGLGSILKGQSRGRAAIGKVVTFLEKTGGISQKVADDIFGVVEDTSAEGIKGYDKTITKFIEPLFRSLIESDLAKSLSKGFGQIVGGIIRTVFDMVTGVFSLAEGGAANAIVDGFTEGFTSMFDSIDGGIGGMMQRVNDILMMIVDKAGQIIVGKIIPMMLQGLTQLIIGGIKSGPVGALIGGGILALLIKGIVGMTGAAWSAAVAMKAAAVSAGQLAMGAKASMLGQFGPQATAAGAKGTMLGAKAKDLAKAGKQFFFGGLKGTKGLLGNFKAGLTSGLKLGAVGGILKAGGALLSGKSPVDALSEGLASAGGAAIGAAIGTVILPGIGTAIGAWIGGMIADTEQVIAPIRGAIESIIDTVGPLVGLLGQIGGDLIGLINGFMKLIPGMDKAEQGFNILGAAVFALLSPFRLLELVVLGLYEAYLQIKNNLGLASGEEKAKLADVKKSRLEKTDKFTIEGRRQLGFSLEQQKADEMAKIRKLDAKQKDGSITRAEKTQLHNMSRYNRILDEMIAKENSRLGPKKEEPEKTDPTKPAAAQKAEKALANVAVAAAEFQQKAVDAGAFDLPEVGTEWKGWDDLKIEEASMWDEFTMAVGDAWESTATGAGNVWNNLTDSIGPVWDSFTSSLGDAWNTVSATGAEFMSDPFYYVGLAIRTSFLGAIDTINSACDMFKSGITLVGSGIEFALNGIRDGFAAIPGLFESVKTGTIQFGTEALLTVTTWFTTSIPQAIAPIITAIQGAIASLGATIQEITEQIKTAISDLAVGAAQAVADFAVKVMELPGMISSGLGQVTTAIMEWVKSLPSKVTGAVGSFVKGLTGQAKHEGNFPVHNAYSGLNLTKNKVYSAAGGMNLGKAISTEMKNKPAGSDLVIANSSETIIPATMSARLGGSGGQSITIGDIHVNVTGSDNPREIANEVAEEILQAIKQTSYTEIFSS